MGNAKERLDKLEKAIVPAKKDLLLVVFPDRAGFFYGGRNFPSIEDAEKTLKKETGREISFTFIRVRYKNRMKLKSEISDEGRV